MTPAIDELERLFKARGGESYGEGVTVLAHSLQAAAEAAAEEAPATLIAAALLHDLGHLIEEPDDAYGYHRHHEAGAAWLAGRFGPEVTEPIRLHVAAKRYLCAVEPAYAQELSPASVHSLARQGGPMRPAEIAAFEREPHFAAAVRLRRWDDRAKETGREVPGLAHYRQLLEALLQG
jgi:phosphonate degradation associated HDIG domain protein